MAAYMVVKCLIHDRSAFGAYASRAAELIEKHGGRYIVRGGNADMLEGDFGAGAWVISEWPSAAAARAFWDSAEYRKTKALRTGISEADVILLETPGL